MNIIRTMLRLLPLVGLAYTAAALEVTINTERLKGDSANLVTSSIPPSSGDLDGLLEGSPVKWRGGKGKPSRVSLDVVIPRKAQLQRVALTSKAPNKWWAITHVKIVGIHGNKATPLLDKDWYERGKVKTSKTFTLDCEAKGIFDSLRVVLSRPHGFINMELSGIELTYANQVEARVSTHWKAYAVGQTCRGAVSLDSTCETAFDAKLNLFKRVNRQRKLVFSQKISVGNGLTRHNFEFPVSEVGEFTLVPELKTTNSSTKLTLVVDPSEDVQVVPAHSKYFMPIGTAHGSAQSGALGFNVRHDWSRGVFDGTERDRWAKSLEAGLVRSNCGLPIKVAGENTRMINAEGKELKNASFHVPRTLAENVKEAMKYWDGHPGLFEVVYYNEHGYHTWKVKGLCDYNPHALALYRKWLQDKHRTIGKLNTLYKTRYESFATVEPPKQFNRPDAAWFDWMQFRRFSFGEYLKDAYALIKPHLPNTRITPKPINFDYYAVSTANDPWLYQDACDVYGYDLYAFTREGYLDPAMSLDFHRTQLKENQDIHFLESNIGFRRPNQLEKTAADMHLLYWPAFLRGLDGVYFYAWYQSWSQRHSGYWLRMPDGVLTPQGRGAAAVAKGVQTLAPVLKTGKPLGVQAAVYFPWEEISQTPNVAPISALRGATRS
jgi:hypothetical protein